MAEKKTITLDLTDCKYLGELHQRIRIAFDFPEWYGANRDAFPDLLRSECTADEVVIIGEKTIPDEFKNQLSLMHKVLDVFVGEQLYFSSKYDHVDPFSYLIES